jgi:hypothetical protein
MPSVAARIKKPAALLAAVLVSMSPLFAQGAHVGFNIGLSKAYFAGPPDLVNSKDDLLARRAGLWADFTLGRRMSIQSGLEFWTMGFDGSLRSYGMLTVITPVHLRIQSLAVPLLLRYRLGRNLFLGAGGYLAHKIGGRLTLLREENDRLERREIGYVLGVGTVVRLFRMEHALELQWREALTPVFAINDDKFYFSTLSLLYGMRF